MPPYKGLGGTANSKHPISHESEKEDKPSTGHETEAYNEKSSSTNQPSCPSTMIFLGSNCDRPKQRPDGGYGGSSKYPRVSYFQLSTTRILPNIVKHAETSKNT